ncbi:MULTISPECIES: aspartate aminotransferase family protein [unclassified Hahella]|uniref:aspartate aminotransferase family protein n=1 Tax=unclassified Hahella TaxID=2624107 RepID=UPI001C1EFF13|nr:MULTISPECIES: aspartate aminotransferase family protein [unclassified Hahella]MBU6953758.1 aspartate aminotransferase family protein [Hahella sp. HN01]MDG9671590.1 aspartate aminotransferase family protein [Hahella sp. CR1]
MAGPTLMNTYGRLPIAFTHGEGCWLYDTQGNRYFDSVTGIAVCGLGHAHPAVSEAVCSQSKKLLHCSNLYQVPLQQQLGDLLCQVAGMDSVFFCNSGAEANEAAIKLARLYGKKKGIESPSIIVMDHSFHGRTLATLSATGNRKVQAGFEPLVSGFVRAPYNDMKTLENIARANNNIVAVMMEPIQGEGGVNIAPVEYLHAVRKLCDSKGWLLMLDEVQTGNGRTGAYFAYQDYGIAPDVVTTAKGLGNGVPIGACLAKGVASEVFHPGSHGSTFGGNPLACAAAMAVIKTIQSNNLTERARTLGEQILSKLKQEFGGAEYIKDIRGKGLMIGIEMTEPCPELVPLAQTVGLLINVTSDRVIRLLPALTMTDVEAEHLVTTLVRLIKLYAADDRKKPR